MIVVRLIRGLGNQMFQYAAARALAIKKNTELLIDTTSFQTYHLHKYGLHHFSLQVQDVPSYLIPDLGRLSLIDRIFKRLRGHTPLTVIKEKTFNFDPNVFFQQGNIYLCGYWQSEKYFSDITDIIRTDFQIQTPPTLENRHWLDRICSSLAVSLHVRRGDYVTEVSANQFHGICTPAYYKKAMDVMASSLNASPTFFVFSDDPSWVQQNLDFGSHQHTFVTDNNADKNYEDLRLMSTCQHHIIANSTFSWWGAWLNPYSKKKVIAPRRWFATENISPNDLIPESWQML